MSFNSILLTIGKAARELAPLVVPRSTAVISAGEALLRAYESLRGENDGAAPEQAEEAHRELYEKVKQHADITLSRLEGNEAEEPPAGD
jgi:hypothetical protein